jgi:predicted nucleotidyltransferase
MTQQEVWRDIKKRLEAAFGDRLRGVLIYGSEARGESGPDSDIDVMVLLEGPVHLWEDIGRCVDATYPLTLEIGRPIHPDPVDVAEFEKGDFAIYRNAKAEGVRV